MTHPLRARIPWKSLLGVLAAAAVVNHRIARRNERRYPPSGKFVEADGVRLHYVEHGQGTPAVLIHGNGSMSTEFAISGLTEQLAREHRVIVFDRPGYGHSERPVGKTWDARAQAHLLHAALRKLAVQRPVIVGHSWGTLVALAMALDHPADVRGLVLLSGYYNPTLRLDVPFAAMPAVPVLGDILRYTILPLMGWLMAGVIFRKLFAPSPVTAAFQTQFPLGLSLRPSQLRASAVEAALMIPAAATLRHRYPKLAVPVVVMAGTGDKIVDFRRQSLRFAEEFADTSVVAVEGAGHMVHHIVPERVVAAVRELTGVTIEKPEGNAAAGTTQ